MPGAATAGYYEDHHDSCPARLGQRGARGPDSLLVVHGQYRKIRADIYQHGEPDGWHLHDHLDRPDLADLCRRPRDRLLANLGLYQEHRPWRACHGAVE